MKLPAFPRLWRRDPANPFSILRFLRRCAVVLCTAFGGFAIIAALALLGMRFDAFVRQSNYFTIENVSVAGASAPLEKEIRQTIFKTCSGETQNLLLLRLNHVRYRIESLPRIRSFEVAKVFPRTLKVKVEERTPVAAANVGDLYWMDKDGVLLGAAGATEIAKTKSPILSGIRGRDFKAGMTINQPMLADALATISFLQDFDPTLGNHFAEWHLTDEDELVGILKEGVEIRFGDSDPLKRLPVLASVLRMKPDWEKYTYMDLRFDSQVVYF